MARTIVEIKGSLTADFMRMPEVAQLYGFEPEAEFTAHFGRMSIENLLFYVVACATWVLETLFDRHKSEVDEKIEAMVPHRPKWYRDKALLFMKDKGLQGDTDEYDTEGMSEEEIEAVRVVKYAAATENEDSSILTIKVAGESEGKRAPLDKETETQLVTYIEEIKDAGVRINVVNTNADLFNCEVDIYYDAMFRPEEVKELCHQAIAEYIENLPFNGEYTNMALVDRLQVVEGVRVVELISSSVLKTLSLDNTLTMRATGITKPQGGYSNGIPINARYIPESGYFEVGQVNLNMKAYQ